MKKALYTAFVLLVGGALSAAADGQQAGVQFKHFGSLEEARAWPKSLRARAMAAMTTQEFYESKSITPILRQEYLDNLKDAYFVYDANINALPVGLRRFVGVSVQDLIDHNMPLHAFGTIAALNNKHLTSLEGLRNVPGIENVTELDLSRNKLRNIAPDAFNRLQHLQKLELNGNLLSKEQVEALRETLDDIFPNLQLSIGKQESPAASSQ